MSFLCYNISLTISDLAQNAQNMNCLPNKSQILELILIITLNVFKARTTEHILGEIWESIDRNRITIV